ncbi:MAG: hypothetical protein IJT75_01765 [Bacteroidaceae bacterium]|nr:hypothetical protein [Bacteroidaceae bacterium]
MKKIMNWVIAATLVCGTGVFTACSNSEDNPAQEQAKQNRKEFVQHTRATMKYMAQNLNFTSWEDANTFNTYFNQYVLGNPNFKTSVMWATLLTGFKNFQVVEPGSELAEMGFTQYMSLHMSDLKFRFTMTADNQDFDCEEADQFEVVINGYNPLTQQIEPGIYKVTLKSSGTSWQKVVPVPNSDGGALVFFLPSEFQFALSSKITGDWHEDFSGILHFTLPEGATDDSLGYSADAVINTDIIAADQKSDKTQLTFSLSSDRVNNTGNALLSWEQNGRKMLELTIKESGEGEGGIRNFDLSQFTNSSSILEVFAALMDSKRLDEGKLTLLDDLTTTISISDMKKCIEVAHEAAVARRHNADQATIDQYTQQMNALMQCTMTCKGVNQTIPMCLTTQKFGVDYMSMPSFNFADESGYVSIVDLLDAESIQYGINIIDHAAEPMQQSVIVVRQLVEFALSLFSFMDITPNE